MNDLRRLGTPVITETTIIAQIIYILSVCVLTGVSVEPLDVPTAFIHNIRRRNTLIAAYKKMLIPHKREIDWKKEIVANRNGLSSNTIEIILS